MQLLRASTASVLAAAGLGLLAPAGDAHAAPGARLQAPSPQQVARIPRLRASRTDIVRFATAPFPYDGDVPGSDKPFLDVEKDGRRGHTTPFGRLYWADETYSDDRVLLHIPKGFDASKPSVMVVFFHGHGATLTRDVLRRQRVPQQVTASGANAVLVAPQLAFNASDSSAGKFWEPGAFARFIDEAAYKLALLHGDPRVLNNFATMPIVLVAYSGGYLPAAWSATRGGVISRVRGVVLLDALYGKLDAFTAFISQRPSAFFVSTYLGSTRAKNAELERALSERRVAYDTRLAARVDPGSVVIFSGGDEEADEDLNHRDLLTHAWVKYPLADLLARLRAYRR